MSTYIRSTASISPVSIDKINSEGSCDHEQKEFFKCIEPDYKEIINPSLLRRMSRVVKMGVYSGISALKKADITNPDAIITGTGLGCIEDTENFLVSIIRDKEQFLAPTAFIQSTHNTIGAQIALILKCNNYNFTYVNRNSSFEDSLTDAKMLIDEGEVTNVLVGGVDELTENSFRIMSRLGLYKKLDRNSLTGNQTPGAYAGEGAAFFVLDNMKDNALCELKAVKTCYNFDGKEVAQDFIKGFLKNNMMRSEDIDVLVMGINGDCEFDAVYKNASDIFGKETAKCTFKNTCGEYFTSSSFAMEISAMMIDQKSIPEIYRIDENMPSGIKNILIYNHFRNKNHSLILLSEC